MKENIRIAGSTTAGDWRELRLSLLESNDNWNEAFEVFQSRLDSRFFGPIDIIKANSRKRGEGFSIALISVVLLEFISAFELGKKYTTKRDKRTPCDYYSGYQLLKKFLMNSEIFRSHFESESKIKSFYENIRCGLVHEAKTLNDDIIISENSSKNVQADSVYYIENGAGILNRDLLLAKIKEHIIDYKSRILGNDIQLQNNFLLKMDELAGLRHVWYFVYGSNLLDEQLNNRLGKLNERYLYKVRCSVKDYEFKYNKRSIDGTSKGNIEKVGSGRVEGVAVLILESKLDEFIQKYEIGYNKISVKVTTEEAFDKGERLSFYAYTCMSYNTTASAPSTEYESKIVTGARESGLPEGYIKDFLKFHS
jgi:hypothetical protein